MKQFFVIKSELPIGGRGVNGRTLYKFLQTYAGHRSVGCCSLDQLLNGSGVQAEYVFLGLPGKITPKHLAKLRYRHLILYDLADFHRLMWDDSNRELLQQTTGSYFKAWYDRRWNFGMQMGLVPVRRYGKLRVALELERIARWCRRRAPEMKYDAMFLGAATGTIAPMGDPGAVYNQRVEWLRELKQQGQPFALWGGLIDRDHPVSPELLAKYGDLSDMTIPGRVSFWQYFRALQQARVALTPQGNAPWSYRHYEAIYAGAVVVTSDFRPIRTLVPLPVNNMIHVEPGQSVLPAIEQGLKLRREKPQILQENILFLERYLDRGMYSRHRPELYERFLSQLPTSTSGGRLPVEPAQS
jgi:hypothetical protein